MLSIYANYVLYFDYKRRLYAPGRERVCYKDEKCEFSVEVPSLVVQAVNLD